MISKLLKLKRNKILFALVMVVVFACLLSLSCVIFDIVQICQTSFNSALLSNSFLGFNIAVMVIDVIVIVICICYIVLRKA